MFYNILRKNWMVFGKSVQGSLHSHLNIPNQDAIRWLYSNKSNSIILSVGDGHGSSAHFRSKIGSHLAVSSTIDILDKFFEKQSIGVHNLVLFKDAIRYTLPKILIREWITRVHLHLVMYPFTSLELEKLDLNPDSGFINKITKNPEIAYGTTMLTAVITERFIILIQIGDGNILNVDIGGNVYFPFNSRYEPTNNNADFLLSDNHTESLCMNNSWLKFKTGIFGYDELKPKLILLCTDGYYNSFRDDRSFLKIGSDYLNLLRNYGSLYILKHITKILKDTSVKGSGDDITVGFLYKHN